jgi:uncharacterized protein
LKEFNDLDDIAVMMMIKQWARSTDRILARLCEGLLFRRLYKVIDLTHEGPADVHAKIAAAKAAVKSAGGDVEYQLFYDEPRDTPYEIYDGTNPATDIAIQYPDGKVRTFAEVAPLMPGLGKQLMFRRLHVAGEFRKFVEEAMK